MEKQGEKAIGWLNELEIDYLEEELKREEEEYRRNGPSSSSKGKAKEREVDHQDPLKTPQARKWVGEKWCE